MTSTDNRQRWLALYVLCLASLMIVLDVTIVNVALPSIRRSLRFSDTSLAWVVNAYVLTYAGFLLLGGRLGDLLGPRRMFIAGIGVFTAASLACGLASSEWMLIAARAIEGLGGATASAVSLSLMMSLFTETGDRARAMGIFGFVAAGGGSIGVVLGGVLTGSLNWHWIFLVNVPVGALVVVLTLRLLPAIAAGSTRRRLDLPGAFSVTLALVLAVYAIVNGQQAGWLSVQTLGLLGCAAALLAAFAAIELRVSAPLVPLGLLAKRNLSASMVVGALWSAAMFAWFFLSALYLQQVLGYHSLAVGLAFLPANLIMAVFSLGLSARIVMRFGLRAPIFAGLLLAAAGLACFARAPQHGGFVIDVLPGMTLLGIGSGMALNPVMLAAMGSAEPSDSGLVSGILNTALMMGGALGLAVLASLAASRTHALSAAGSGHITSLLGGYHLAFAVGAAFAASAAVVAGRYLERAAAMAGDPALDCA
jgi:EmrB/QacA subfamily drug resistance transporter